MIFCAAGLAGQPVVEGQLQAFLAAVVDVGETQHVRHRFAVRVEAAELALAGHARDPERESPLWRRPDSYAGAGRRIPCRRAGQAAGQLVHAA